MVPKKSLICTAADLQNWSNIGGAFAQDWLFHSATIRCGCGEWDNDQHTLASRIFLPVLFLLGGGAAIAAVVHNWHTPDEQESDEGDSEFQRKDDEVAKPLRVKGPKRERMWHLDFARIVCIAATVSEHSGGTNYSENNFLWVQQWVLPYLYLISGMAFMLSKGSLWAYELRLLVVLLVGFGLNYVGTVVQGQNWKPEFGYTLFQMSYVALLMIMSIITEPLRRALRWRSSHPSGVAPLGSLVFVAVYGLLAMISFGLFASGYEIIDLSSEAMAYLKGTGARALWSLPLLCSVNLGLLFILQLAACLGRSGTTAWIIIALIYLPQMVIPYSRGGHSLNLDLFIFGMLVMEWSFAGAATISKLLREYWPLFLFTLLMFTNPHVRGRCDLESMNTLWERFRFYSIEVLLNIAMTSGAMNTSDSCGVTPWLNMWALYAYLTHIMWARMLPVPWGAVVSYLSVLPFLACWWYERRKGDDEAEYNGEAGDDSDDE